MKKLKKLFAFIAVGMLAVLCAGSAFACVPPWWGAEEELPEGMSNLYRGKARTKTGRFQNMLMKGYQAKSFE